MGPSICTKPQTTDKQVFLSHWRVGNALRRWGSMSPWTMLKRGTMCTLCNDHNSALCPGNEGCETIEQVREIRGDHHVVQAII